MFCAPFRWKMSSNEQKRNRCVANTPIPAKTLGIVPTPSMAMALWSVVPLGLQTVRIFLPLEQLFRPRRHSGVPRPLDQSCPEINRCCYCGSTETICTLATHYYFMITVLRGFLVRLHFVFNDDSLIAKICHLRLRFWYIHGFK